MRSAILMFFGMLLAVLIGLGLFHAFVDRKTPLEHATVDADRAALLIRDDFARAAGSMKTSIAEYYASTGKMPGTNAAVGLSEPTAYRGQTLRSATVEPDGSITFEFDANSGHDGGRIRLIADVEAANAMGVQWRCETGDYPLIVRALPACTFKPAGKSAVAPQQARLPTATTG